MVKMSQSVPSTQVVSSVVTPAMPLPAQLTVAPLTGPSVADDGVEARARLVSKHRAARERRARTPNLHAVALLVAFSTKLFLLRDLTIGEFWPKGSRDSFATSDAGGTLASCPTTNNSNVLRFST